MEIIKEYQDTLKTRYMHLYGNTDVSKKLKKEQSKLIITAGISLLVFLSLVIGEAAAAGNEYSNIIFNDRGEIVSVIRPDSGEDSYAFNTRVTVVSQNERYEKEYYITIEPVSDQKKVNEKDLLIEKHEKNTAESELKSLISAMNEDTGTAEVVLPRHLENGSELIWQKTDSTDFIIYLIGELIVLWLIYRNRFHSVSREEKNAKESIIRELPEFINKLVLLINAGVILNTAFLKAVEGCEERKARESYFYRRLAEIGHMVNEMNASFYNEMYYFARHSGVKELMRITNIMIDNVNKGDDLSDKLRRENELLWFARKQQAEEKGRLAETKMTLPLLILLTVLIMVTIAPALMEM